MSETPQYIIVSTPQVRKFDDVGIQACLNECGVSKSAGNLTPSDRWLFVQNEFAKYLNEKIGISGKMHFVSLDVDLFDHGVKSYLRNNGITHILRLNDSDYQTINQLFVGYENIQKASAAAQNVADDASFVSERIQVYSEDISSDPTEIVNLSATIDEWAHQGKEIVERFDVALRKTVEDLVVLSL
jgi:hypothetical protein